MYSEQRSGIDYWTNRPGFRLFPEKAPKQPDESEEISVARVAPDPLPRVELSSTPVADLFSCQARGKTHPVAYMQGWIDTTITHDLFLADSAPARDNTASAWVTLDPSRQQSWRAAQEWWGKFDDVAGYRNTAGEVRAGLKLIDEYFIRWMRLEYVPAREEQTHWTVTWLLEDYTSEVETADLARILDALCGVWGIRSCYDAVGSTDAQADDPDGNWQRTPWLYQLGVPTTRSSRERLYQLREERQRAPLNLSGLEDHLSHATIRFYQNLARLKPETCLLPEKEYTAAVIQRSTDEEDALIAHANRLRRCGLALSVKPPSYW